MPRPLTPKQEAFCHKYVECGNASEAYRFAYDAEGTSLPAIHVAASRLLSSAKVALRVSQLEERSLAHVDVTALDIARTAWQIASNGDIQPSARVSALALLAKRHPEFSDKHEVQGNIAIQAMSAVANMSTEELKALVEGAKHD